MNSNDFLKQINTDLFITPSMYNQKEYIPKRLSDDIETRFGVELEVCVKINPKCIKYDTDTNLSNLNASNSFTLSFKDKFDIFFKSLILSSPTYNQIRDKYKYFIVKDDAYFIYDMNDIIDKNTGNIKSKEFSDTDSEYELLKEYKVPIFMDDASIICGDVYSYSKYDANIKDSSSFHFECITPILSINGEITKSKVCKELSPYLLFFGLYKPNCFIENYSMGFHVNASLFDKTSKKYISIASSPLLNHILKKYVEEERNLYSKVRTIKPSYHTNGPYVAHMAQPLYKNINKEIKKNNTISENNIINSFIKKPKIIALGLEASIPFIERKQRALKKKTNFLLEFRLFEGRNSIDTLCKFTNIALNIVHMGTENYLKSSVNLPLVIGGRYTKKVIKKKKSITRKRT